MAIAKEPHDAHVELSLTLKAGMLPTVRRFVSDLFTQVLDDPDLASRIVVATHELLENAASYSLDGRSVVSVSLRRSEGGTEVAIDTQNRASALQAATLQDRIDEIVAAPDPASHYQELMRRTARQPGGSGLGLGRVRAEADMSLSCRVAADTVFVSARATYQLPRGTMP